MEAANTQTGSEESFNPDAASLKIRYLLWASILFAAGLKTKDQGKSSGVSKKIRALAAFLGRADPENRINDKFIRKPDGQFVMTSQGIGFGSRHGSSNVN